MSTFNKLSQYVTFAQLLTIHTACSMLLVRGREVNITQFILPISDSITWVYRMDTYHHNTSDTISVTFRTIENNNEDIHRIMNARMVSFDMHRDYYENDEGLFMVMLREDMLLCPRNPQVGQVWGISIDGTMTVDSIYTATYNDEPYQVYSIQSRSISTPTIETYIWAVGLGLLEYEVRTKDRLSEKEYTSIHYELINVVNNRNDDNINDNVMYTATNSSCFQNWSGREPLF